MSDKNLKPWQLERIALGEQEGGGGPSEREALASLATSNREILETLPAEGVVREVERRAKLQTRRQARGQRRLAFVGIATAAIAAAVLFVAVKDDHRGLRTGVAGNPYQDSGSERVKGSERLLIQVQGQDGPVELAEGSEAAAGDLIQLSYLAAGQHYGVIISIDGNHTVTQHLPENGDAAAPLNQSGRTALPSSYELDDAPKFERFYFVSSQEPFAVGPLLKAAKALPADTQRLPLADGLHQSSFTVRKVKP